MNLALCRVGGLHGFGQLSPVVAQQLYIKTMVQK
jgi:hypothetical protein